jgi:hypothetical protein
MHIGDRFVRLLLRIVDAVANAIMSARLRIVDWIYGPEPPTPADRQRETEKGGYSALLPRLTSTRNGRGDDGGRLT